MREGDIVLLYKKGDSRDPRNYRPITLLQVDYKILTKILVARMKKIVNNFVSKEQLGFVPKRGDGARKAQGGGEKRNLHLVFRGRWTIARGPSHTPFGGVRNLANTYRRCGAN
eukprot:scaffold767_cov119-Isochrysis_galbana.AAC.2